MAFAVSASPDRPGFAVAKWRLAYGNAGPRPECPPQQARRVRSEFDRHRGGRTPHAVGAPHMRGRGLAHGRFECSGEPYRRSIAMIQETTITLNEPWLEVQFPCPHSVLSWACLGGGWRTASTVLWHRATDDDLPIGLDPLAFFLERIDREGKDKNAIGFLSGVSASSYVEAVRASSAGWVRCLATVGLGNGVRVGDPSFLATRKFGTINILLQSSLPLSLAAS